ncbi:MAG: glycosyltransferase [Alphaproteobacteria bacterium]
MLNRWRRARRIAEQVRTRHPQRIWIQDVADLVALRRDLPSHAGVRCLISDPPPPDPQTRKQLHDLLSLGGHLVADSAFGAATLQKNFGIGATQIEILPPAIDAHMFDPGHVTAERALRLAERWRVPEGSALLLHIGALHPGGGQTAMLEALARLTRRDVYVVFLGEESVPGYTQQLMEVVERRQLLGQVLFVDQCPDLAAALWFAHAVAAVNETPHGAMPEILAAQAMGRPVIVTNAGAHVELVAPGETAWVIPPHDNDSLKNALQEVLSLTMQERLRLAVKMQQFVSAQFAYGPWLEAMLDEDTKTTVTAEAA